MQYLLTQDYVLKVAAVLGALLALYHLYITQQKGSIMGYPCYCKQCQTKDKNGKNGKNGKKEKYKQNPAMVRKAERDGILHIIYAIAIILFVLMVAWALLPRAQQLTRPFQQFGEQLPFRDQRADAGF